MTDQPLAIDLFCGLGGWTEGLIAEGFYVVGFDIEAHAYGEHSYPGQLVLQDVLTLHGRQFRHAALIVASPPCQQYSYRAMPWRRARALPPPDNSLFDACFRIQREACEAAGHHVPLVVENVKGAQKWVGRSRWNYGSYHLWGDVPALMPMQKALKNGGGSWFNVAHNTTSGTGNNPVKIVDGVKNPGQDWSRHKRTGQVSPHWNVQALPAPPDANDDGVKFSQTGAAWFDGKPRDKMLGSMGPAAFNSQSSKRKAASALIAKIPLPLARHIARTYRP